jgi:hypothetical protein
MSEKKGVCISLDKAILEATDDLSSKLHLTRSKTVEMAILAGLPSVERMAHSFVIRSLDRPIAVRTTTQAA